MFVEVGRSSKTRRSREKRQHRSSNSSSSSTSSVSSDNARRQVRSLKKRLASIENSASKLGVPGSDETLVPIFDPQINDLTIEAWVS